MKLFEDLNIINMKVEAIPGSHIAETMKQAIILALTEERNVAFSFNGIVVDIIPADIISEFFDIWERKRIAKQNKG